MELRCQCAHGWKAQYDISDVYLGVIAKLGANGVEDVLEVDLSDSELAGLKEAAIAVAEKVTDLQHIDY